MISAKLKQYQYTQSTDIRVLSVDERVYKANYKYHVLQD